MIHPHALAEPFFAPLHRSFLFGCFLSGMVALIVLPLHLAFAGPPHVATVLILAWMFSQWPLAHYLSQSGHLDRAIGISAGLFATFVAGICLMTGADGSFALLWLLIPPIEAAFAGNRRISVCVSSFCVAIFAALHLLPAGIAGDVTLPPVVQIVSGFVVVMYVGILSLRISTDRKLARGLVASSKRQKDLMAQCSSEVMCEIGDEAGVRILGGPVQKVLGAAPMSFETDWLFQRIHVADRPLYLSHLSRARHERESASIGVRVRFEDPTQKGLDCLEYRLMTVAFRPSHEHVSPEDCRGSDVLMGIRVADDSPTLKTGSSNQDNPFASNVVSQILMDRTSDEVRAPLAKIVSIAKRLSSGDLPVTSEFVRQTGEEIRRSSEQSMSALAHLVDLVPGNEHVRQSLGATFDAVDVLNSSVQLMRPSADQQGIEVSVEVSDVPMRAICDQRLIKKGLCLVLSDMIETAGEGAQLTVSCTSDTFGLSIKVCVRNREKHWNLETATPTLDYIAQILSRAGGKLETYSALGNGDTVVFKIPGQAKGSVGSEVVLPTDASIELAETA